MAKVSDVMLAGAWPRLTLSASLRSSVAVACSFGSSQRWDVAVIDP